VSLAETELKCGNREPAPEAKGSAVAKAPDPPGAANNSSVNVARIPADLVRMEMGGRDLTVGVVQEKGVTAVNAAVEVEWAARSKAWREIH